MPKTSLWPGLPKSEVPIRPITNGVHIGSWVSHDMKSLLDRYLGPAWSKNPLEPGLWDRINEIPNEELWRVHETRRARLVGFARGRLEEQMSRRGASREEILNADAGTCAE